MGHLKGKRCDPSRHVCLMQLSSPHEVREDSKRKAGRSDVNVSIYQYPFLSSCLYTNIQFKIYHDQRTSGWTGGCCLRARPLDQNRSLSRIQVQSHQTIGLASTRPASLVIAQEDTGLLLHLVFGNPNSLWQCVECRRRRSLGASLNELR